MRPCGGAALPLPLLTWLPPLLLLLLLAEDASAQPCFGNADPAVDALCGVGFANRTGAVQSSGTGPAPSDTLVHARCCERIFCEIEHCDEGYELVPDACCGRRRIPSPGVAANNTICCQEIVAMEEVVADLAREMTAQLGETFLYLLDVLPHAGSTLSCIAGLYVIASNKLQDDDADKSLLEEIFSFAAGCSGLASFVALTSIRVTENMEAGDEDAFFCQLEGAGVTYFQMCTVMWLTAGASSVYEFVWRKSHKQPDAQKPAGGGPDAQTPAGGGPDAQEPAGGGPDAQKPAGGGPDAQGPAGGDGGQQAEGGDDPDSEGKALEPITEAEIAAALGHAHDLDVLKWYTQVCMGIPLATVSFMVVLGLLTDAKPSFSFQQLGESGGWCTINMNSPVRTLLLFYLPLVVCMFYSAACYFFCWQQVKSKQDLVDLIENEILYDTSAHHVQKRTQMEFHSNLRASRVVRLSLAACSVCWVPPCGFALLAVANEVGAVGTTPGSLQLLGQFRGVSSMVNPLFGIVIYLCMEACFNLRQKYNMSFHRKLRRLRWKLCGPPKYNANKSKKRSRREQLELMADDEHGAGIISQMIGTVVVLVWQLVELVIFSPWALAVWLPMDTFRSDVESNFMLGAISTGYMIFLAMPATAFFVVCPLFYQLLDSCVEAGDADLDDTKLLVGAIAVVSYQVYCGGVLVGAKKHLESMREDADSGDLERAVSRTDWYLFGLGCFTLVAAPLATLVNFFPNLYAFFDNADRTYDDAHALKHDFSVGFVYSYIAVMFVVVGYTMWLSRRKTELNFIKNPESHAAWSLRNVQRMISEILMNIQLSALLLTHGVFADVAVFDELESAAVERVRSYIANSTSFNTTALEALAGDVAGSNTTGVPTAAEEAVPVWLAAPTSDTGDPEWRWNFAAFKGFMLDAAYFERVIVSLKGMAFDMKLVLGVVAVIVWLLICMIPIVMDSIRLKQNKVFVALYRKLDFVQETLAGPFFLVILQAFLAAVDCTGGKVAAANGAPGRTVVELKPSQVCWEGDHLTYAVIGLTGLMAYVPLACLTMVVHEQKGMDFRFTPLYDRLRIVSKGVMALICQFTNTISPFASFPLICCLAVMMSMAVFELKPCCIFWMNRMQMNAYLMQFWTGLVGMFAYYNWEPEISLLPGMPLTPAIVMLSGWSVIIARTLMDIDHDRTLLKRSIEAKQMFDKKTGESTVSSWRTYMATGMKRRDKLQLNYINNLRLAKNPDDTETRFSTHHEVLTLIYVLQSDASANTKQRALQVLAAATSSTSEKAVEALHKQYNSQHEGEQDIARTGDNVYAISMQTRRRLMGFTGDAEELDDDDYHFPELVLVSPYTLIDLLAQEFNLTRARDETAAKEANEMWLSEVEKVVDDDEDEGKKKKKKRKKKEEQKVIEITDAKKKTGEILYLMKRTKALVNESVVAEFGQELPQQFLVNTMLSFIRKNPPDVLRLQVSGAGAVTMGEEHAKFEDEHLLKHILELPEDRIERGADSTEDEALKKIRMIRRMYSSMAVHQVLEKIDVLPSETLDVNWEDELMQDDERTEDERQQHKILAKIARLEKEKEVLDNEIRHMKDAALSNVAKVYLMRILAVYAEEPTFCKRIMDTMGAQQVIDYLLHGDYNLQTAATVCLYQMARQDPECLDALLDSHGGMVFVATKLTHPEQNGVVTHRIAADLLVEIAKRFEMRSRMVASGLIGPLLQLADAYAQLLKGYQGAAHGEKLRQKIEQEIMLYSADQFKDAVGKKADVSIKVNTTQLEPWCPFEIKGVELHATHVFMCIMRIFQQLSDEDFFRSEFVGRHQGLEWIADHVFPIVAPDVKIMALRVLMGLAVEPFGFEDILEDPKMLREYVKMHEYKETPKLNTDKHGEIKEMILTSNDKVARQKMHRVAEFLCLEHKNASKKSALSDKVARMVVVTKLSEEETSKRFRAHDTGVLEIVRERTIIECFGCLQIASTTDHEIVRDVAITVLCELCSRCMHMPGEFYSKVRAHMARLRLEAIARDDVVQYEEVVAAMICMARMHRIGRNVDYFKTANDAFEHLWLYHHLLQKDLDKEIEAPFWDKVRPALNAELLDVIRTAENTVESKTAARPSFCEHPNVHSLFWSHRKATEEELKVLQEEDPRHYFVELKPRTRQKINAGVSKAIRLAQKVGDIHNRTAKEQREMEKILSRQATHMHRADAREARRKLRAEMDAVDAEMTGGEVTPDGATKVRNPLEAAKSLSADLGATGTRFRAEVAGNIRSGLDNKSQLIGMLDVGQEIVSLEIEGNRVRFDQGWVSIRSEKGKAILTVVEENVPLPNDLELELE